MQFSQKIIALPVVRQPGAKRPRNFYVEHLQELEDPRRSRATARPASRRTSRPEGSVMTVQLRARRGSRSPRSMAGRSSSSTRPSRCRSTSRTRKSSTTTGTSSRAGGDPKAQVCGWLKDKYGLSWQVVPSKMVEWFGEPDEKSQRAMCGDDENGQARHRRARTCLQRLTTLEPDNLLDALQWPAMAVTLLAAWLVASRDKTRRAHGFWWFIVSNMLWIVWAWHVQAWALIALQVGLFAMNVRGAAEKRIRFGVVRSFDPGGGS